MRELVKVGLFQPNAMEGGTQLTIYDFNYIILLTN
jgi:hypothetical protein